MSSNPFIGVFYHWLGGLAAASFYLPYRGIKKWSWETYWLVGGFFSWLVAPWVLASLLVPELWSALRQAPLPNLGWAYLFGVLWGIGGLTFGLTMRYLGIALGVAVALGFCAVFGTVVPPIFNGEIGKIAASKSGQMVLLGVVVCVFGIVGSGLAGMSKERELSPEQKKAAVKEFNFGKGMFVAIFAGIMSSCFAYGLAAGKPLAEVAKTNLVAHGRSDIWQNLPVLCIVLAGGFTTNFIWCVFLNFKNRSGHEYLNMKASAAVEAGADEAPAVQDAAAAAHGGPAGRATQSGPAPLASNYFLAAIAGVTWYLQFFFYSMGATKMGKLEFSSWTLHMASIIIFSTLWGIALKEWAGVSGRTKSWLTAGLAFLILSTVIIGYGNSLGTSSSSGH
jgi:L-rhamnose-H+ transport protein